MGMTDEQIAYRLLESLEANVEHISEILDAFATIRAPLEAEIRELKSAKEKRDREEFISHLISHEHLKKDEAVRLLDSKCKLEYEYGSCRACGGEGLLQSGGCFGGRLVSCRKCDNRNPDRRIRLRLPWAPSSEGPITPTT
jgi:hypothetical protein